MHWDGAELGGVVKDGAFEREKEGQAFLRGKIMLEEWISGCRKG